MIYRYYFEDRDHRYWMTSATEEAERKGKDEDETVEEKEARLDKERLQAVLHRTSQQVFAEASSIAYEEIEVDFPGNHFSRLQLMPLRYCPLVRRISVNCIARGPHIQAYLAAISNLVSKNFQHVESLSIKVPCTGTANLAKKCEAISRDGRYKYYSSWEKLFDTMLFKLCPTPEEAENLYHPHVYLRLEVTRHEMLAGEDLSKDFSDAFERLKEKVACWSARKHTALAEK